MVVSHRWLRYAAPFLHLVLLAATPAAARRGPAGPAALAAPRRAPCSPPRRPGGRAGRPGLIARYYVLTQASIAAGLWDHLRHGTPAGWAPPEGTR